MTGHEIAFMVKQLEERVKTLEESVIELKKFSQSAVDLLTARINAWENEIRKNLSSFPPSVNRINIDFLKKCVNEAADGLKIEKEESGDK